MILPIAILFGAAQAPIAEPVPGNPTTSTTRTDKLANDSASHSRDSARIRHPEGSDLFEPGGEMGAIAERASGAPFLCDEMSSEERKLWEELQELLERCCGAQACFKPNCGCSNTCQHCAGTGGCSNCAGKDVCPHCKGGRCPICDGAGKCATCKGEPGACPYCTNGTATCLNCRGTGIGKEHRLDCRACGRYELVRCGGCGGSGSQRKITIPCDLCDGAGIIPTLLDPQGSCPRCYGSGSRQLGSGVCTTCFGSRWVKVFPKDCERCGNSRVDPDSKPGCKRCGGKGTNECTYCFGSNKWCDGCGQARGRCRRCGDGAKCLICSGTGKCPKHKPTCDACRGSGQLPCPCCKGGCCPAGRK
jgi:hypothetical protein